MTKQNVSTWIVKNDNGVVDRDATVAAFAAQVDALLNVERESETRILSALNSVFDRNPGQGFQMRALVQMVLLEMAVPATDIEKQYHRVHRVVQTSNLFRTTRGPSAGTYRVADLPQE